MRVHSPRQTASSNLRCLQGREVALVSQLTELALERSDPQSAVMTLGRCSERELDGLAFAGVLLKTAKQCEPY